MTVSPSTRGQSAIDDLPRDAKAVVMPVTTVFKDRLPKNVSFSVGAAALSEILGDADAAVYFVHSSTWVRQAAPLTKPELPLLRWQRQRPRLRVGNERVRDMPEDCSLYIIVYAVPSAVKHDAYAALVASASAWLPISEDVSTREGAFVEFGTSNARSSVTYVLPNWW